MYLAVQILEKKGSLLAAASSLAMASDRVEVDTARPFRSVKEAVAVFGDRILVGVGESHSRLNANAVATANPNAKQDGSGNSSSSTITLSPNAMAEVEAEPQAAAAIVPMYSAPSTPPSFASSPNGDHDDGDDGEEHDGQDEEAGLAIMSTMKKLEAEVAETRREVVQLRKRGAEMEMAVASLNAQLHRGLSRLAEMEADKAAAAARRSTGGDTDVTAAMVRSERWAEKSGAYSGSEYLPSFSHALSLGEIDYDYDDGKLLGGGGGRRRKAQKVKPIVPLIGNILFSKSFSRRKSTNKDNGDLYGVLGC